VNAAAKARQLRATRLTRHSESAHFQIALKLLSLFSRDSHKGFIPPDDEDIHIAVGPDLHVCHGVQIDDEIFRGRDEFAHLRLMLSRRESRKQGAKVSSMVLAQVDLDTSRRTGRIFGARGNYGDALGGQHRCDDECHDHDPIDRDGTDVATFTSPASHWRFTKDGICCCPKPPEERKVNVSQIGRQAHPASSRPSCPHIVPEVGKQCSVNEGRISIEYYIEPRQAPRYQAADTYAVTPGEKTLIVKLTNRRWNQPGLSGIFG
jgi:hypothetical protein